MTQAEIYNRLYALKERADLDADTRVELDMLTLAIFDDLRRVPNASNRAAAACIGHMLKGASTRANKALAYTWTDKNGLQCACDGYRAYRLRKALPLPVLPDDLKPLDLERVFEPVIKRKTIRLAYVDRGEVNAYIELQRAEHGRKHAPVWEFGDGLPAVNAVYLFELLTVLPDAVLMADPENPFAPVYAASELGDAVLLPVRKAQEKPLAPASYRIIAAAKKRNPEAPEITLDQLAIIAAETAA